MKKYLCNTYDPTREDACLMVICQDNETQMQAWQREMAWLADKVIGEPVATERFSVEQLKALGMVGVYVEEVDNV